MGSDSVDEKKISNEISIKRHHTKAGIQHAIAA
jgi:hypothetical protein